MLAAVIIIQVMSVFEAQRRTTTGTADAQTNGGIALYNIARELQMSGYPLIAVTDSALECTTVTGTVNGTAATPGRLSPVSITNDVVGAGVNASPSDTITIRYGTAPMGGVPTQLISVAAGLVVPVASNLGCQVNDISLITNGPICAMSTVTAVTGNTVPNMSVTLADATGASSSKTNLACMGAWNEITYAVNNGNLERNGVPSVAGIVNLQVQYGISAAANSNQVTAWVDASGGTWAAPTVANRNRIKSVRIAVVARNAKMETDVVTTACSSTTAASPTGLCAWEGNAGSPAPTVDLSAGDPNWARYRYRVFETIIPLRNMIWSRETL
jgi:type IV pilus assembly protein PilW